MISPYLGLPIESWENRTRELIDEHPLEMIEINDVVLKVWNDIFSSGIGSKPFKIGEDLFPRPQIMAYFLHELIPLEFSRRYPGTWRREETADE
ncbi:MAG: ScaI family restriction endonuclease, partial [Anaerolineae bacterium]